MITTTEHAARTPAHVRALNKGHRRGQAFARAGALWVPERLRAEGLDCSINRMGCGGYENIAGAPSGPNAPLSIITSLTPAFFLTADLGVTVATGASAWADQTGNGNNGSQASGTAQPAYAATDPDFGGKASLTGDGINDTMSMPWNPPAPGTLPIWFLVIMRQVAWSAGAYVFGAGSLQLAFYQSATTPQLRQANVTAANTNGGLGVGVSGRCEVFFSGSTSDYLKAGSTASTRPGTSAGTTDVAATAFALFSRQGGVSPSNVKINTVGAWLGGEPTSGEKSAVNDWINSNYSGSVLC